MTDHPSGRLPERTAAVVCRWAGLATRLPAPEVADELFSIAMSVACVNPSGPEFDAQLDRWEDQLRAARRRRRDSLWSALKLERHFRRSGEPPDGEIFDVWEQAA